VGSASIRPSDLGAGWYYLIDAAVPRTKKNHARIVRRKDGTPFVIQAKTSVAWEKAAVLQLQSQRRSPPITTPVNLRALVYREKRIGDLGGFLAAICDALERASIVENDRLILGFDGSRLLHDKVRPRVELYLNPLT
jgi:Holliday junction resolvase RusA-like endonuclease